MTGEEIIIEEIIGEKIIDEESVIEEIVIEEDDPGGKLASRKITIGKFIAMRPEENRIADMICLSATHVSTASKKAFFTGTLNPDCGWLCRAVLVATRTRRPGGRSYLRAAGRVSHEASDAFNLDLLDKASKVHSTSAMERLGGRPH